MSTIVIAMPTMAITMAGIAARCAHHSDRYVYHSTLLVGGQVVRFVEGK